MARECEKLVVLCADSNVDACAQEFVQEVFRPDLPRTVEDYFRWGRKDKDIHHIDLFKPILKRTFVVTKPLETIDMMVRDLRAGKRVVGGPEDFP